MKINRWLAQLTSLAALIALAISPTLGLANTPAKTKGILHHDARQTVHFQGDRPANAQGADDASTELWVQRPIRFVTSEICAQTAGFSRRAKVAFSLANLPDPF